MFSLALAACGGGGESDPPPPPPSVAPGWSSPALLETNTGDATFPKIAVDAMGNAIAIWIQYDGPQYESPGGVWANRFDASSGAWGTAQLIETLARPVISAQIAVDAGGNAIAVWDQYEDTFRFLDTWTSRFSAASGTWGTPQLIETNNEHTTLAPQIAFDSSGNAIAVWSQILGVPQRSSIVANRFNAASGTWGTAQLIETNAGHAQSPQIAFDGSGNAIAVWSQSDGTGVGARYDIWANRFNAASGTWGMPELIETENAGNAFSAQIAVDGSGNGVAVWIQYDGPFLELSTRANVWTNRFSVASGTWGIAQSLGTALSASLPPRIAVDTSGNAIAMWEEVVWQESVGPAGEPVFLSGFGIRANRFSAASGAWGTAQLVDTDDARGSAFSPQIAFDAEGNAIAVWSEHVDTLFSIRTSRFSAASGTWGAAGLIEIDNAGDAFSPQIAVAPGGNAIAVWEQSDGTRRNIVANRFRR